jgi:glycine oxidase
VDRPADIIVVGAGIVGCAIAHELARRGASVEVVDDRPIGMGATQASAGILAPYIEAREESPLFSLAVRSLRLYEGFVALAAAESGIPVPFRRTGTLEVAYDESELRSLEMTASVLARRDVPARLLDAAAARVEEPHLGEGVLRALVIEAHAFVAAADLTRALASAARRNGAQLLEPNRVRRIASQNGDISVETDKGPLVGNAVVLAAGSWSGAIEVDGVETRLPVRPVRGQLVSLTWRGAPLRRVIWSNRCYFVPWEDGTVLLGATAEDAGFDERTTVAGVRDLLEAACDVVPQAWNAGFNGARVGLRPATPDALPAIGRSRVLPNLIYATGHFRNGILLAPLTAQLVADLLLENKVDPQLASIDPARFGVL